MRQCAWGPNFLAGITLIGLVFAVVGLPHLKQGDKARATAARWQTEAFATALEAYKHDTGEYPATEQGLQALRVCPDGVTGWQGPYLPKDIPNDPWNRPYIYRYPGAHGDKPDVETLGPK